MTASKSKGGTDDRRTRGRDSELSGCFRSECDPREGGTANGTSAPRLRRTRRFPGDTGLPLVMGVLGRDGGPPYRTVLFYAPDGRLLGKHRKLMPTAAERLV